MSEAAIALLENYNLSGSLIVFIISLFPILELRGGLIAASILQIPVLKAFIICYIANMIPIPFILLFIKTIFKWMKKVPLFVPIIERLENSALRKSGKVKKRQDIGLFLFVAIPLPGTGGWTGALISSLLDLPIKRSLAIICTGVFTAGLIMITLTYFVPGLFGF